MLNSNVKNKPVPFVYINNFFATYFFFMIYILILTRYVKRIYKNDNGFSEGNSKVYLHYFKFRYLYDVLFVYILEIVLHLLRIQKESDLSRIQIKIAQKYLSLIIIRLYN